MAVQSLLSQQHELVDALESNALGHQEFNQPKQDFSFKGQMNRNIEIFCLSLYLHQTLKRTILNEIWVKIFSQSFIEI